jgi:hypothetical protein
VPAHQILGGIEFGQMSLWRLQAVEAQPLLLVVR